MLQRSFSQQYAAPYGDCTVLEDGDYVGPRLDDSSLFDALDESSFAYAQADCIALCKQLLVADACGCLDMSLSYTPAAAESRNLEFCMSESELNCSSVQTSGVFAAGDYIHSVCLAKCPLECRQSPLSFAIAQYLYPYNSDMQLNTTSSSSSNVTSKLSLELSVFYNALAYSFVEEEPKMTFEDLVGTIGGHLHIFLGMSSLSFVELFETALVLGILGLINKKRQNNKMSGASTSDMKNEEKEQNSS